VDAIADLIDGLVEDVLGTLIKIAISTIAAIVYLFSTNGGQRFIDELGHIIELWGELFSNLGKLILDFILSLPGIKEIISVFRDIIVGACGFLEDAINFFADPDISIGCDALKRDLSATGWVPKMPANITYYWQHSHSTCSQFVHHMNSTVRALVTQTNDTDLALCISGLYWIAEVEPTLSISSTDCDHRMVEFYHKNVLLSSTSAADQEFLTKCGSRRIRMLRANRVYDFIPPSLMDDWRGIPSFFESMFYGFRVYNQYRDDRLLPVSTVQSQEYQSNYRESGFSVSHLEALSHIAPAVIEEALANDDPAYQLTMDDYATRSVAMPDAWGGHNARQTASVMRFWDKVFGSPSPRQQKKRALAENTTSILSQFFEFAMARLNKQKVLPVPKHLNWSAVADPNSTTGGHMLHLGSQAVFHDLPLHLAHTFDRARKAELFSKGVAAGQGVIQVAYAGVLAGFGVVRDIVTGTAFAANVTQTPWAKAIQFAAKSIWQPRPENETLSGMGFKILESLNEVTVRTMGVSGPLALYNSIQRLVNLSSAAAIRRARTYRLAQLVSSTLVRTYANPSDYEAMGVLPLVSEMDTVSLNLKITIDPAVEPLPCRSPYQELCQFCAYLDQGLGVLIESTNQTASFYQAPGTQEPSFNYSQSQFEYLDAYLSNFTYPAEIGDAPYLPIRYPWYNYSNWRIVGDPTPNKLRFMDLADMFQNLYDFFLGPISGDDPSNGIGLLDIAQSTVSTIAHARIWKGLNRVFADILSDVVGAPTLPAAGNAVLNIASASIFTMLVELFDFIYSWFKTCSFREEINGSKKRFSIGESILIMIGVAFVMGIVMGGIFPGQILTILGGLGFLLGMAILYGTLVVSYSWSYLCVPALPFQLADDIMYFLTHTLLTRCDWMFAGIIKNETYTNDQCAICENYDDDTGYEYADCYDEIGFYDLGYNLAFTLNTLWPASIEWLNTTSFPLLTDLMHLEAVQTRLNAFPAYNSSDAISYSIHQSCNAAHTWGFNLAIAVAVSIVLSPLRPFVSLIANMILGLIQPTFYASMITFSGVNFIMLWGVRIAHAEKEALGDTNHIAHDDARDPRKGVGRKMARAAEKIGRVAKARYQAIINRKRRREDDVNIPLARMY
jgi:hypothetical protein